MKLTLIKNDDNAKITLYRLARAVYAETSAASLPLVEAFATMVCNICTSKMKDFADIATDPNVFECLRKNSPRNKDTYIDSANPKFQMCLRVVKRMLGGDLPDSVNGATRFHRADESPDWATPLGYIAEVGDFLFYL